MAEACTITTTKSGGAVRKLKFAWTSAADGTCTSAATDPVDGEVLGLTTVPDGVAAPTDDYDVALNDADSVDVLAGAGANRDTANTEHVTNPASLGYAKGPLTLEISNAGDSKQGTVYVWIR